MILASELRDEVEKHIRQRIASISPLSAANTAQIYRVVTESKTPFVAKVAEKGMDVEAWMLAYLKEKTNLPVPSVFYSNDHVIIMQFISAHHSLNAAGEKNAAEALAALHAIHADSYGFERDTLISSLLQPNKQSKSWVEFFSQQRLLYMAGEALKEGKVDKDFMKKLEKLISKLDTYIKAPAKPSLIHGDVWGGNILAGNGAVAAFLDPAIYFADPEIELAFIRLLNTFGDIFFHRYNEINPIQPGFFEERADIYSLYPLLVHTRLFGISYARKALRILDKFVS